ncbi:MAG: tRNA pseudouridine(38-40) synthase TruA [bacterium]|nr:tRNA pseudouridine(38-40) synthase TruA [bacterium]
MANIRLLLEYDGSKFHGWQKQPSVRTVQEELHKVLELVLQEKIHHVQCSGRTDEGVHSRGQVANFFVEKVPDLIRLKRSVSSIMKGDLSVLEVEIVPDTFHSLRSAKSKFYRYVIYNSDVPPVLEKGQVWLVHRDLDIERMKREALLLLGKQDFACFQGSGCGSTSTIKTIYKSEIISNPPYIYYEVIGSGFLKHMVRNIVGTLVEFGKNEGKASSMKELLESKNRQLAGPTAPGWGLCLEYVEY